VLSRERYGWEPGGPKAPFREAVDWLCKFTGQEWGGLTPDHAAVEKLRFVGASSVLYRGRRVPDDWWPLGVLEPRLETPSPYFLGRGYSAEVLRAFRVGDSRAASASHPMFRRAVVPVLDESLKYVVGATGRSLHPACGACRRWHDPADPCPAGAALRDPRWAKWRNTAGFAREQHLYGLWAAAAEVRRTGVVALVEGPGDLWRLWEAGVRNAVALFGAELTDAQQVLLEGSGALSVVLLLDRDEAGVAGADQIERDLARAFRVHRPAWESGGKDLGDLSVDRVRETVLPALAGVKGW
jgi:5S rRNA maturation endonuclease (ribonuclease M5)